MSDGSAGFVDVPTRLLKLRSKRTVAAPAARNCAGTSVPEATASVRPGLAVIGALWPAKSTQTGVVEGPPQVSAATRRAAPPPGASARSASAVTRGDNHFTG